MTTLIIAAHPDDEVLGCGGIIKKFSKKEDFYVLILSGGADTRYDKSMENVLKNNAKNANKILGTKEVFFENLPNQKMDTIPILEITQITEKYIAKLQPTRVFTHHIGDLNKDHQIVAEATFTATRPIVGQVVKEVYSYNVPSSTEWNFIEGEKVFIPNTFIDIKKELDFKLEAMECYESECREYPHPRSIKALKAHSNYWGLVSGYEFAEPFKLIRKLGEL
ncbi:MAG: PIG-L deacetylase family protein [Campylobacterota bacterium]|nr:PIG-L deacetylase family protein [Campylobacterota bacterium]